MSKSRVVGVILCGGDGTRLWPLSRQVNESTGYLPKQFLDLLGTGLTMIQETADRLVVDEIIVVTNPLQARIVRKQLPNVHVLEEPCARNTAAAIGLAAVHIASTDPDAVMIVCPSDHVFKNVAGLRDAWHDAVHLARQSERLVLIGIEPTWPHPKLGYIKQGENIGEGFFAVERFQEKPGDRAAELINSGGYLWNSGMFVWSVKSILSAMAETMPQLHRGMITIQEALGTQAAGLIGGIYKALESKSIDYGVLEMVPDRCGVIPVAELGWQDIGSWDVWADAYAEAHGQRTCGDVHQFGSGKPAVYAGPGQTVVTVGVPDDFIVIACDGTVLVLPKDQAGTVGDVVKQIGKAKPGLL